MKECFKVFLVLGSWYWMTNSVQGQNLVPNPSFETYTTCPTAAGQAYYATPWTAPTTNDADYFNVCSSTIGIPHNGMYPRTGNAMAGFWGLDGYGVDYREYFQVDLLNNLQNGKCYYIEFFVNLSRYLRYAINNIAAHISNTAYPTNMSFPGLVLNLTPHALKFNNPVIYDTLNWTRVSGIYKANGTENHIIIGNFKDDSHTDTLNTHYGTYGGAYYFIDDVSVLLVDSISLPPEAGRDTTIVMGDSVFIGQQLYGLNCNWYNNSILLDTNISGIWVKPNTLGPHTYVVEQNLCGKITYDTVLVSVNAIGVKQYKDSQVKVFPNPAKDELTVSFKNINVQKASIEINNVLGETIYATQLENCSNKYDKHINLQGLANRTYIIQIKMAGTIYTDKLIISN
jgi:hypothetical protein